MPGAKTGFPVLLADQLKDYFVIGCVLGAITLIGQAKMFVAAHGDAHGHGGHGDEHGGHGDGHGDHGHAEEHHRSLASAGGGGGGALRMLSGHHVDPNLDLQVTLGICVVLITVTIAFEVAKHHLEHNVPPMMSKILAAMFGELTVLGFLALFTYMMLRFGVLEAISLKIYHDPEHLIHLFEDIHFMLFFVMLCFLFQACILVGAAMRAEEYFQRTEKLLGSVPPLEKASGAEAAAAPAVSQMLATYKAAREGFCNRLVPCPRMLWSYREAEAKEELTYSLLRARFIFEAKPKPGVKPLPDDFDFSTYLRHRMVHEVAHTLHVTEMTWFVLILFIGVILYTPVIEHNYAHIDINVNYVIGLGWFLWLLAFSVRAKLGHILYMLTPPHALLDGPPASFDEEAPTASLLAQKPESPPYEKLAPTPAASKHERLFWRGRQGPAHLLFLMRLVMLMCAITLAVIYTWLDKNPQDVYMLLLAALPVLDVMITAPKSILPYMVMVTSVEMMKTKGAHEIAETLTEMKTEKTLKMLKMLNTLQAQAKRVQKMQKMEKGSRPGASAAKKKPKALDAAAEAELRVAFELFDKDKSGSIDQSELAAVLASLGMELSESDVATMYAQMDPSGDGVIDFDEFCEVMAPDPADVQTPAQVASSVFLMLDTDGSGKVNAAELRAAVIKVNPALTDDDIEAAMELFDKDKTGTITEKEFRQGIELMKTFG